MEDTQLADVEVQSVSVAQYTGWVRRVKGELTPPP